MVGFLSAWLDAFWFILVESGVWLIAGFALAGVVHTMLPAGLVERQLAGKGIGPIVRASLLGIPLPLCSCSVIPVAAGLRRDGAGRGATAAFAISTPQTGEESIPLTWGLFGPVFALTRPVVAVFTALTAGVLIERFGGEHKAVGEAKSCPRCGCGAEEAVTSCGSEEGEPDIVQDGLAGKFFDAFRHGFVTMPLDLAPWLAVGLVLAALVSAVVPQNWIAENVGTGVIPMLGVLVIGIPLYVCATSSTPLAFTLVAAGLSPGAALVLLLAGPATNIATISWTIKDLGIRSTVIYLVTIGVVAVACGLLFDAFLGGMIELASSGVAHEHERNALFDGAAVAILMMLGVSLMVRFGDRFGPKLAGEQAHG